MFTRLSRFECFHQAAAGPGEGRTDGAARQPRLRRDLVVRQSRIPQQQHFPVARRELLQCGAYLQALAVRVQSLVRRRGGVRWLALQERQVTPLPRRAPRVVARHVRRHHEQPAARVLRSEEHTSELQSQSNLVCRLLLEKKKKYHSQQSDDCTLTYL